METQKKSVGDILLIGVVIGSVLYAVGFIPITLGRIAVTLLSLCTGRWRKIGFPSLGEGAFVGAAILWLLAAPTIFAHIESNKLRFDYDIVADKLAFSAEPKEPHAFFKNNPEGKSLGEYGEININLVGQGKIYVITPDKGKPEFGEHGKNIVVMDGPQVLLPRDYSHPEQGQAWLGLLILVLGFGGFTSGVFRKH